MTYRQSPLKIVAKVPVVTKRCDNPPDPIDLVTQWRKRLADFQAVNARRMQRIDWYLTQRTSRCQT